MAFVFFVILAVLTFLASRALAKMGMGPSANLGRVAQVFSVLLALLALARCLTVIPAGNVGIIDFFGTVSPNSLRAGINFVNPFARIVKMTIKTQEMKETMDVPSKEGLTVKLEISVLYHLNPDKAADVYKTVGEDYVPVILEPQFRSVTRGVTAMYEAKALYTSERDKLALEILREMVTATSARGLMVESTPLRRVGLPPGLTQSIEAKLQAEQESQRMEFVLTREKQEADRKRIEGQGIADFQKIVVQGISDQLLRWKGIEATEKLAASPNAKVVVIGAGKDGLPLILDTK
jgi:regulator of protease activity HflC (stomatin/prohibitin superfamily)